MTNAEIGRRADDSPLLAMLLGVLHRFQAFAHAMAYVSGALFLLLAFYMSVDSFSRYLGGPFSGVSDDVSVLVLGFATTWALAYALAIGAHVQIDVLLPLFSTRFRHYQIIISLLLTTIIAGLFTYQTCLLSIDSYEAGITSVSMLRFPLWAPQAVVTAGLAFLTIQAALMTITQAMTKRSNSAEALQANAV